MHLYLILDFFLKIEGGKLIRRNTVNIFSFFRQCFFNKRHHQHDSNNFIIENSRYSNYSHRIIYHS
ncbi:UNVERIFIED_CONTAM: hypothetical protein FKN15_007862 [Acipenser sinensis]